MSWNKVLFTQLNLLSIWPDFSYLSQSNFFFLSPRLDGTLGKPGMFLPGKIHCKHKRPDLIGGHHSSLHLSVYTSHIHKLCQTKYEKERDPWCLCLHLDVCMFTCVFIFVNMLIFASCLLHCAFRHVSAGLCLYVHVGVYMYTYESK